MKQMKKCLCGVMSLICAAVMIFVSLPEKACAEGLEDTTAPTLTKVSIDKNQVEAPGTVTVKAEVSDDLSGVKQVHAVFRYTNDKDNSEVVFLREDTVSGGWSGTLNVDLRAEEGEMYLDDVQLMDKAGNVVFYVNNPSQSSHDKVLPNDVKFNIINNNKDLNLPKLNSISLDGSEVSVSDKIGITADITDTYSEIRSIDFEFVYVDNNEEKLEYYVTKGQNGEFKGEIGISEYTRAGKVECSSVKMRNAKSEVLVTYTKDSGKLDVSFTIKNDKSDTTAPVLKGVKLDKAEVTAPGIVEIIVDATDDISGIDWRSVKFGFTYTDNINKHKSIWYTPDSKGNLKALIDISQYDESGEMYLTDIWLCDNAGNKVRYINRKYYTGAMETFDRELDFDVRFTIKNDSNSNVSNNTDDKSLVDTILKAPAGSTIKVDYTSNSILSSGAFAELKYNDKTLSLESNGVVWEFYGKDIIQPTKNVDLHVDISKVSDLNPAMNKNIIDEIKQFTVDKSAVVVKFAENGVLPGKAKIRIKADYAMKQYLGNGGIYVYYYDNMTKKMVPIATDIAITYDDYIEFTIEHCSYYVMANRALTSAGNNDYVWDVDDSNDNSLVASESNSSSNKIPSVDSASSNTSKSPVTGDFNMVGIWMLLMLISGIALLAAKKKTIRK